MLEQPPERRDVARERARRRRERLVAAPQAPQRVVEAPEEGGRRRRRLPEHGVERLPPPGDVRAAVRAARERGAELADARVDGDDDGPLERRRGPAEPAPQLEDTRRVALERAREAVLEARPQADGVDLELFHDLGQVPEAAREPLGLLRDAADPGAGKLRGPLALAEGPDDEGLERPLRRAMRVGDEHAPEPRRVHGPVEQVHDGDAAPAEHDAAAAVDRRARRARRLRRRRDRDAAAAEALERVAERGFPRVHVQHEDAATVAAAAAPQHLGDDVHRRRQAPRDDGERVAVAHKVDDRRQVGGQLRRRRRGARRGRRRRRHRCA